MVVEPRTNPKPGPNTRAPRTMTRKTVSMPPVPPATGRSTAPTAERSPRTATALTSIPPVAETDEQHAERGRENDREDQRRAGAVGERGARLDDERPAERQQAEHRREGQRQDHAPAQGHGGRRAGSAAGPRRDRLQLRVLHCAPPAELLAPVPRDAPVVERTPVEKVAHVVDREHVDRAQDLGDLRGEGGGVMEERTGRGVGHDLAPGKEDHAIGATRDELDVVGGQQDRSPTRAQRPQEIAEARLARVVEPAGGLVEQEHPGAAGELHRQGERQALPLGQVPRVRVVTDVGGEGAEDLTGRASRCGGLLVRGGALLLHRGQVEQVRGRLGNQGDVPPRDGRHERGRGRRPRRSGGRPPRCAGPAPAAPTAGRTCPSRCGP
nr:hypothetical protein DA06_19315 [Georgenia sp. SUBG003]